MDHAIYDRIGSGYDTTRRADPEIARRLHHHLQIADNREVIDIACGSGNYTVALKQMGINISGMDISSEMLAVAQAKSNEIPWVQADVQLTPFRDQQFGGAVCTLAIHHFPSLSESFREVHRVLKKGSRFVIFSSTPEQMSKYWLNAYFPEMMRKSMVQMPSIDAVKKALDQSGFHLLGCETFMIEPNLQDFFLYSGKYLPALYLDPDVRKGISSFASLAGGDEVADGLKQLEADLLDGSFHDNTREYTGELGDYLFVVAEKSD